MPDMFWLGGGLVAGGAKGIAVGAGDRESPWEREGDGSMMFQFVFDSLNKCYWSYYQEELMRELF